MAANDLESSPSLSGGDRSDHLTLRGRDEKRHTSSSSDRESEDNYHSLMNGGPLSRRGEKKVSCMLYSSSRILYVINAYTIMTGSLTK